MNDRWLVAAAFGTCLGAYFAYPLPWLLLAVVLCLTIVLRSSLMATLWVTAAVSTLSAHAWAGLDAPLPDQLRGPATLTGDPVTKQGGSLEVRARSADRLYLLRVPSDLAHVVRALSAGETVSVQGEIDPLSGRRAPSLRRRHLAGVVKVDAVAVVSRGNTLARLTNDVRRNLVTGSSSLTNDQQSLLTGFVMGDDRRQSTELRRAFEEAGLSHLTAVSGANVAFLLIVALPLLQRFGLTGRYVGALVVLVVFGVITRWEPSVVRAEVMAALVLTAQYLGRTVTRTRVLGLAVVFSLLADPFLVGSVAFLLSISACIGMAVAGEAISKRVPGPQWLGRLIGYSAGAQLGVAPVHYAIFGPMPIAALPANVLAEPAAGLIMIWGVCAGTAAGIVGEPLATILHWPTALLTDWVAWVARTTAGMELGVWSWPLLSLAAAVALLRPLRSGDRRVHPLP